MAKRKWPDRVRVINPAREAVVGERVSVAQSMWARGRGLMWRAALEPGTGLLIDPCSSIHSMWMRFPIDVLYMSADDTVLRVAEAMPPWRIGPLLTGSRYVIELPVGTIAGTGTQPGDRLVFEPIEP